MPFGRLLSRFLRNRDAGVAPMMALAALPLFGFVGAGQSVFPYYGEQINFGNEVPTGQDLRALIRSPKFATSVPRTLTDKPRGVTPKANVDATPKSP